MAGYSARVKSDIDRWVGAGMIDAATAARLVRDVEERQRRSPGLGSVLAMLAALLFAAAILIFVAANWEAFARIARVLALFALILAGYVGGAVLKGRGHFAAGEAAWLVAAAAFGGSIALIGQMYHLSGDEASALVVWGAGTALAALALRSNPLTVAAVGIADAWLLLSLSGGGRRFTGLEPGQIFVPALLALFALSFWSRSQPARHLIVLSLIFYAATLAVDHGTLGVSVALAVAGAGAFAIAVLAPGPADRIVQLGGRLPFHGLVGYLTAMGLMQFELIDGPGFVAAAALALAGIALAILFGGRDSRGLRWLAYVGFAFELCLIYIATMGSMLGTAGFFLVAAVTLSVFAFVVFRIEKRMVTPTAGGAAV